MTCKASVHWLKYTTYIMAYKLALELYTVYNTSSRGDDWVDLNMQQTYNNRTNHMQVIGTSRLKV